MEFNLSKEIEQAKAGDLRAFERILKEFDGPILNFLYRRLNNAPEAEDLMQDTFLRLYLYLPNIRPEDNVKSLIFTIANHLLFDFLRKKQRKPEFLSLDDESSPASETIGDDSSYYFREDRDMISRALPEILEKYQLVVDLYYFQGFTTSEISNIISIPENTVKTNLARARKQLKEILERHESI